MYVYVHTYTHTYMYDRERWYESRRRPPAAGCARIFLFSDERLYALARRRAHTQVSCCLSYVLTYDMIHNGMA